MHLKPAAALLALAIVPAPLSAAKPVSPKAAIAKVLTGELRDDFTRHSQSAILAAIKPVDINSDGVEEWEVNFNDFGAAWCGTGGCRYQLWLGRKGAPPLKVFDRQMREVTTESRKGRVVFVFDFHGSECGETGSMACPGEFTWGGKKGRMILLPTPAKHTANADPIDYDG